MRSISTHPTLVCRLARGVRSQGSVKRVGDVTSFCHMLAFHFSRSTIAQAVAPAVRQTRRGAPPSLPGPAMIRRSAPRRPAARAELSSARCSSRALVGGSAAARPAGITTLSRGTHRTRVSEMRPAVVRPVRLRPELRGAARAPHRLAAHHGDIANGLDAG